MTKIHRTLTNNPNCDIIELAVVELRRYRELVESLRPLKLTLHIPPRGSHDPVALEITAKLKDE